MELTWPRCAWTPTAPGWELSCRKRSCSTGTIWENVAFSRPDASDEQILAACRIARVDEFAETFEKKYETVVANGV